MSVLIAYLFISLCFVCYGIAEKILKLRELKKIRNKYKKNYTRVKI